MGLLLAILAMPMLGIVLWVLLFIIIKKAFYGRKWLLVGNGECKNLSESAKNADVIIQINACRHLTNIPKKKTHYIFVTNTGQIFPHIIDAIRDNQRYFCHGIMPGKIILARNPTFYRLKRRLHFKGSPLGDAFYASKIRKYLSLILDCQTISFRQSYNLERKMRSLGMPAHFMPSTGMIAYDWICKKMCKGDSLMLEGFTFEGWDRHPWEIEKKIIIPWNNC